MLKTSLLTGATLVAAALSSLTAAAGSPTPAIAQSPSYLTWGINGHPTCPDYADWVSGNMAKAVGLIKDLGCTYYRCSFQGAEYPSVLSVIVPPAQSQGVTILPILPLQIVPSDSEATNYQNNYQMAYSWGSYAINKGYQLPYWELGNELENGSFVSVIGDGSSPNDFPDKTPGGFAAIAAALEGAYKGIHDAYTLGQANGTTTITPQVLFGATYRHWGLLTKIADYEDNMPWDVISWHWYEPCYGLFTAPISDTASAGYNRTPADCLADFKTPEGTPMTVWITELNRSVKVTPTDCENGSFTKLYSTEETWTGEANAIQTTITDLEGAPNVKALFVYELLDEPQLYKYSIVADESQGHFGLVTYLEGSKKKAFFTVKAAIKARP